MILDCWAGSRIKLWVKGKEKVRKVEFDYQPWFYLHLPDPHRHADMIEGLEGLYRVEECQFKTIYGELDGYRIYCEAKELRRVAEKITFLEMSAFFAL